MRVLWLAIYFAVLIWSGIHPGEYLTWSLEVMPAVIGLVILAMTEKRFPLTRLCYTLVLIHFVILMIGGHYTYANEPVFNYLKDIFRWQRNNYDKAGHFAQGFVPAIIAREVFIRLNVVNGKGWRAVLIVAFCLAISAVYELFEWWVALIIGQSSEAFLGTQGYAWDTQSDMAYAFFGAIIALLALSRLHDAQLRKRSSQ